LTTDDDDGGDLMSSIGSDLEEGIDARAAAAFPEAEDEKNEQQRKGMRTKTEDGKRKRGRRGGKKTNGTNSKNNKNAVEDGGKRKRGSRGRGQRTGRAANLLAAEAKVRNNIFKKSNKHQSIIQELINPSKINQ
jgi:hypothetical protein